MTVEMNEQITFTRADADRMTRMETLLIGMDQKIDDKFEAVTNKMDALTTGVQQCQSNCADRRGKVGARQDEIEKEIEQMKLQNTAKTSEEKGFFKGRKADVAIVLGAISIVGTLAGIWAVFHG